MSAATQLGFIDPLEPRVLPFIGRPFWTLNIKRPGERMQQRPHRLADLEWVLRNVRGDADTYMSQAFFNAPCRRAVHLSWLTHALVDLDIYNLPACPPPQHAAHWVRQHCHDNNVPAPSLIIFSGRGIYLKWMWSHPLPRPAAGRAVAVNKALVRHFEDLGADPRCTDVSRILRVVGTTNSKSGERAEILWQEERDGGVLTYNFDEFADQVLPYTMAEVRGFREASAEFRASSSRRAKRQSHRVAGPRFAWEDWHWGCLEDIRTLAAIRYGGKVPEGHRDIFGHLGACQIARVVAAAQLWPEILAWARILLPSDYVSGPEFKAHCSTLLTNARRAASAEKVEFEGKLYSPVYTYRKETMIERLEIAPHEMPQMKRLIDDNEKARRLTEARRARGVIERAEYEARATARRGLVGEMRQRGLTWRAIGVELGISESEARRLGRNDTMRRVCSTSTAV